MKIKENILKTAVNKKITIPTGIIFLLLFIYFFFVASPISYPDDIVIEIEEGKAVGEIALQLKNDSIIKNATLFKLLIKLKPGNAGVIAGEYYLTKRMNIITASRVFSSGDYGIEPIKILIPEGLSNREIADIYGNSLIKFNKDKFLELANDLEGYLFPDTYFFFQNVSEKRIVSEMNGNFNEKIETLGDRTDWEHPIEDVVIMASLLEKEARRAETRKKIAGILWKRFDAGMALQVDAVFLYFLGKNSLELTLEDLKYDSPYNTYKYIGLPPGPIANPGLDSINAAIYYEETPYWYYLSDMSGITHYAVDFEGHKANKQKYLR